MKLIVNEIFYSLQGEGARTGSPSIFIRLAKCNLTCSFCDTDFETGVEMSLSEILDKIKTYPCEWIIWTGGEPTLQLSDNIVEYFKEKGYKQAIETNGTKKLPRFIDYVTCSPKVHYERIKNIIPSVDEIRIPIAKGDQLPEINLLPKAKVYYVSPIFDENTINKENVDYCIELVKNNSRWSLSLQIHKLLGFE